MCNGFKPENYIKSSTEKTRDAMLLERGISVDDRGKTKLDACQFLKYAMSVTESKQNADGIWFYNFSEKHYELLENNQIRKIFYYIFAQADESLWRSSMQVQYMEQYLNKVPY